MYDDLGLCVVRYDQLTPAEYDAVCQLCSAAFATDYSPFLRSFAAPTHVLARLNGRLVGHALWVTRWLQPAGRAPLRTAYVEGVAVDMSLRRQGIGTMVMRRVGEAIQAYELGGLSTGSDSFYARLGWQSWCGPLSIRTTNGEIATPADRLMVLLLPQTPRLDLSEPMSAEWRDGELW
jgi:aminoglycoside 2'-N-acetyltransferase I